MRIKLAEAVAQAESELQNAIRDGQNPHFRDEHASLASATNTVRPAFTEDRNAYCVGLTRSLLDKKKIPTLAEHEYQEWAEYLFSASFHVRIAAAEAVFRHDRQHPRAQDLFLACAWPLAHTTALQIMDNISIFPPPSDLTYELLYDGAAKAAVKMFQKQKLPDEINFRRALFLRLKSGALLNYFTRLENTCVLYLGSRGPRPRVTTVFERQVEAKDVLEQITNLEPEPETARVYKLVQCIIEIGPSDALKAFRYGTKLEIDLEPVMKKLQIGPWAARQYLCQARKMLKAKFDPDGTFFIKH
jgi:hypothetical protein